MAYSELMTQQEMIAAFSAQGVSVRPTMREGCTKLDDGTYGPIVTRYGVVVVIRDARHGNTVVREFGEADAVDVVATVKEMRAEVAKRAKETKTRIRAEKTTNRS